ncbi:hypothetical protein [Angustibacter speluncae]
MTQRVVTGPGTQRCAGVEGTSASRSGRTGGVLPRAGLALAGCVAATGLVLGVAGPRVGGQAQGEVLVWVLCLPALVVVPGVLLRGRVGWPVLLNAALAMGAAVWLLVPGAVAGAHPTSTRLAQDVSALAVPDGQQVVERRELAGEAAQEAGGDLAVLLRSAPSAGAGRSGATAPATGAGRGAAAAWGEALEAAGFAPTASGGFERGRWTTARVLPQGDGALVLVVARG